MKKILGSIAAVIALAIGVPASASTDDITDVLDEMPQPDPMGERAVWQVVDVTLDAAGFAVTTYPFETSCTGYRDDGEEMAVCYLPFRYDGDSTYRLLAGWFQFEPGVGWLVDGWVETS